MRVTRFFPYRVGRVLNTPGRLELPRPLLQGLEDALVKAAGMPPSNHVVYEIDGCGDRPARLWFTDSSVFIGDSVELRHPERHEARRVVVFDPPRIVATDWGLAR